MTTQMPIGPHRDPGRLTLQDAADGEGPLYLTIRDALAEEIRTGQLAPGARLPSERELAARHGVARMTARKALGFLESEGSVYSADRRGYFVSPQRVVYNPVSDINMMRQLRLQGLLVENIYLGRQLLGATEWHASHFETSIGTPLALERCVVEIEGRRTIYSEDSLLLEAMPEYSDRPYVSPLTQNLQRNYGIRLRQKWARTRVTNISFVASKELKVSTDTPGLNFTHVQEAGGRVVMVSRTFWLSDAVDLVFDDSGAP